MSGHSKWANTRYRKERQDAKKGKIFSRLAHDITIATKTGGPDPEHNSRLRIALQAAKNANMPKENIERAIKKGTGELGEKLEEFFVEGYGPARVALLIKVVSDNKNRGLSEIRNAFNKFNAKLVKAGGVKWMFKQTGRIVLAENQDKTKEEIEMAIINSGAKDYEADDIIIIYTEPADLDKVREYLEQQKIKIENLALIFEPKNPIEISEKEKEKFSQFLEEIESLEDVSEVYANLL